MGRLLVLEAKKETKLSKTLSPMRKFYSKTNLKLDKFYFVCRDSSLVICYLNFITIKIKLVY